VLTGVERLYEAPHGRNAELNQQANASDHIPYRQQIRMSQWRIFRFSVKYEVVVRSFEQVKRM